MSRWEESVALTERRHIEPEMQLLYSRFDAVAEALDRLIVALVGERRAYTLLVHPKDSANATMTVSNTTGSLGAVREWVRQRELSDGDGDRLSDEHLKATYGSREKFLAECKAHLAERERDTYLAYTDRTNAAGLELLPEPAWAARHAEWLDRLRANIKANELSTPLLSEDV